MYLVDSRVIREARRGAKANPGVGPFWPLAGNEEIYIAAQIMVEMRQALHWIRAARRLGRRYTNAWNAGYRAEVPFNANASTSGFLDLRIYSSRC